MGWNKYTVQFLLVYPELINQIVQKRGKKGKIDQIGMKIEEKILGKTPKIPNLINAQDLMIAQGGFFPQKQTHSI